MAARKSWTPRRREILEAWIKDVQGRMALEDWNISVNWKGNEETHPTAGEHPSALATMTPMPSSKHASMTVSDALLELPGPSRHQVLVHEMVHCHLFALHECARSGFEAATKTNKLAEEVLNTAFTQHVESATDALADAFVDFLPEAHLG